VSFSGEVLVKVAPLFRVYLVLKLYRWLMTPIFQLMEWVKRHV
jgi:hypothetical protein